MWGFSQKIFFFSLLFFALIWGVSTDQRLHFLEKNIENQWHKVELSFIELWAILPNYSLSQEDTDYLDHKAAKEQVILTATSCKEQKKEYEQLDCYLVLIAQLKKQPSYENFAQKELHTLEEMMTRYRTQVNDYNKAISTFPNSLLAGLQRHVQRY